MSQFDSDDFYKRLGIPRDADENTIKKAYRKLSIKWHPDKNPDNLEQATATFQKINEANSCLSDPKKRALFDRYGKAGVDNPPPFDIPPEVFKVWMMMRSACAVCSFIYTTVLAVVFIMKWSAASAVYEIYDESQPEKYTNYRCLVTAVNQEGETRVLENHAEG